MGKSISLVFPEELVLVDGELPTGLVLLPTGVEGLLLGVGGMYVGFVTDRLGSPLIEALGEQQRNKVPYSKKVRVNLPR